MAAALPAAGSPSAARVPLTGAPPACSAPPLPDGPCPVCPRLAQEFEPWRQASSGKARYDRARQRADLLKQAVEPLRAPLRLRAQQLFGRKAQTRAATAQAT